MPGYARALVLVLAAALAGCGGRDYGWEEGPEKEKPAGAPSADQQKRAAEAADLERQALASWEKRDEVPQLQATIETLKKLLAAKGGQDYATYVWLSRAHYILGELTDNTAHKLDAYEAGMKYGDLALNTIPEFRARFERKQEIEEAVEVVGKEHIDAIYWDAVNTGKWAKTKGATKILFMKEKVKKMIDRCLALDETWFFGAPHRYLGAYFAGLPAFSGRDLDKSRKHFERAKAIEPNYFATHTLMAEYLARGLNDRKMYKSELEYVLKGSTDALPKVSPEQRIEKAKAKVMLDEIDEHFDADEGS
jgi:hypothetical protein